MMGGGEPHTVQYEHKRPSPPTTRLHLSDSVIRPRPSADVDRSFKLSSGDVTFDVDNQLEGPAAVSVLTALYV